MFDGMMSSAMDKYIDQANELKSNDYAAIASRFTAEEEIDLTHAAMGAVTESAELLDAIKRHLFYGREVDVLNVKEECGDILWYLAVVLKRYGWTFEEIAATNLAKLRLRYPNKFRLSDAINRDTVAERIIMEQASTPDLSHRTQFPASK